MNRLVTETSCCLRCCKGCAVGSVKTKEAAVGSTDWYVMW